jgi:fructose-1-phosphate kinase PfkB-like protein
MARALEAEGVQVVAVEVPATRRCVTAMDAADGSATEFYERALPLPEDAWDAIRAALDALEGGWLAVSGSVPPANVPALALSLAAAARRGVRVVVDLQGDALRAVLDGVPVALVKVNRAEAGDLFGPGSAPELAAHLRAAGAEIAVVTDGSAGAAAASAGGRWRATPGERGTYPVGSGDSFLAGLLAGARHGDTLDRSLALATAAAAANTRAPGAGRFSASDVRELLPGVRVVPIPED